MDVQGFFIEHIWFFTLLKVEVKAYSFVSSPRLEVCKRTGILRKVAKAKVNVSLVTLFSFG